MRTSLAAALTVTTLALAGAARADEASGFSLGLRAAYGVPLGDAGGGAHLNDLTTGAVPVQLDAGWRFDGHWAAGAYFAWGPTFVAGAAEDALRAAGMSDVSGHFEQRVGVQGLYTFDPLKGFSPWLGLGVGYEWTRYADGKNAAGNEVEVGVTGYEASLQLGAAWALGPRFSVGPFATLNVGQYRSDVTWVENGGDSSRDIADKGVHEWLQFGVRGSFDL